MSDIVKVTEEEFDEEGNLTRRTVTEYGGDFKVLPNTHRVGDIRWPYGQITAYNSQNAKLHEPY